MPAAFFVPSVASNQQFKSWLMSRALSSHSAMVWKRLLFSVHGMLYNVTVNKKPTGTTKGEHHE